MGLVVRFGVSCEGSGVMIWGLKQKLCADRIVGMIHRSYAHHTVARPRLGKRDGTRLERGSEKEGLRVGKG